MCFIKVKLSVKVKPFVLLLCVCNLACKGRPRNDLYCVGRDVKPYSPSPLAVFFFMFCYFLHRFAHQNVVKSCILLLADFTRNSLFTNHCAVKLLHRIAFDHNAVALLFQARLFRVFTRLLNDSVYSSAIQYKVRFCGIFSRVVVDVVRLFHFFVCLHIAFIHRK